MNKTNRTCRSLALRTERDRLIAAEMWKVDEMSKNFMLHGNADLNDLKSYGYEQLVKLYSKWDPTKASFSTYVNRCLRWLYCNYLRDHSRLVKLPRSISDLYLKINKVKKAHPEWSCKQIAAELDIPLEQVVEVENASRPVEYIDSSERDIVAGYVNQLQYFADDPFGI